MARLHKAVLGTFSKKIGQVVGSSWKGIPVIRSLPQSVANPRTTAQQSQRLRFKTLILFAQELVSPTIKPLWDRNARRMSGYNLFVRTNRMAFDDQGNLALSKIRMSIGRLLSPLITDYSGVSGGVNVTISTRPQDKFAMPTDMIFGVWYDLQRQTILFQGYTGDSRGSSATTTAHLRNQTLYSNSGQYAIWIMFRNAKGNLSSESAYITNRPGQDIIIPTPFMLEEVVRQMGTAEPKIHKGVVISTIMPDSMTEITDDAAREDTEINSDKKAAEKAAQTIEEIKDMQSYARKKEIQTEDAHDTASVNRTANYERTAGTQSEPHSTRHNR